MTKPVDLDALDAAYAKPHSPRCAVPINDVLRNRAELHFVLHDAYPAMAAELRERRAREEAHDAELRALREVAEAASEVSEYHRVYGTETIQDVNVDALRAALAKVPR